MAFQFTPPGVLNRLRASVVYNDHPELNVTSNFLTTEGIRLALEGNATDLLPAMVSLVSSPAPYLAASITMSIVRSATLAAIRWWVWLVSFPIRMSLTRLSLITWLWKVSVKWPWLAWKLLWS